MDAAIYQENHRNRAEKKRPGPEMTVLYLGPGPPPKGRGPGCTTCIVYQYFKELFVARKSLAFKSGCKGKGSVSNRQTFSRFFSFFFFPGGKTQTCGPDGKEKRTSTREPKKFGPHASSITLTGGTRFSECQSLRLGFSC